MSTRTLEEKKTIRDRINRAIWKENRLKPAREEEEEEEEEASVNAKPLRKTKTVPTDGGDGSSSVKEADLDSVTQSETESSHSTPPKTSKTRRTASSRGALRTRPTHSQRSQEEEDDEESLQSGKSAGRERFRVPFPGEALRNEEDDEDDDDGEGDEEEDDGEALQGAREGAVLQEEGDDSEEDGEGDEDDDDDDRLKQSAGRSGQTLLKKGKRQQQPDEDSPDYSREIEMGQGDPEEYGMDEFQDQDPDDPEEDGDLQTRLGSGKNKKKNKNKVKPCGCKGKCTCGAQKRDPRSGKGKRRDLSGNDWSGPGNKQWVGKWQGGGGGGGHRWWQIGHVGRGRFGFNYPAYNRCYDDGCGLICAATVWLILLVIGVLFILDPYRVCNTLSAHWAVSTIDSLDFGHYSSAPWVIFILGWLFFFGALWGLWCSCWINFRFVGGCNEPEYGYNAGGGAYGNRNFDGSISGSDNPVKCRRYIIDWVQVLWIFSFFLFATFIGAVVQMQRIEWDVPIIYYFDQVILGSVLFYILFRLYLCPNRLLFFVNVLLTTLVVALILHIRYWLLGYPSGWVFPFFVFNWIILLFTALLFAWIWDVCRLEQTHLKNCACCRDGGNHYNRFW